MNSLLYYIKRLQIFSGNILYWNILGMSLISFFEGISLFLLISLLGFSGIFNLGDEGSIITKLFNIIDFLPNSLRLPMILGFFILMVIGQNIIQKNLTLRNSSLIQGFIGSLRVEAYRDLLGAEWSFFTRNRKSDLINIMTIELARVAGGINQFLLLINFIVFTLIQIGFALWLSFKMTVFVLLCGVLMTFFSRKFIIQSKQLGNKTSLLAQEYLAGISDQLNGIRDIKSNSIEDSRLNWMKTVVSGMFEEQMEYMKLKTASQIFYKMSSTILIGLFIYLSFLFFNAKPAQFLLIIIIFSRLWPRITGIQSSLEQISSTIPAFQSFRKFQNDSKKSKEFYMEQVKNNATPITIESDIRCNNLWFRYDKKDMKYTLQDINLIFKANEMTAIVGHSGAGKSTLIDLLMGLNKPETGEILIDGKPLAGNIISSLRKTISYVPQDPFLFNATIRENMKMMVRGADDQQIWNALEFAAAAEFVKKLPNGLDTIVGDRGILLSGGERQRIVLARAVLKKPSLLILDEATSALDSVNEARIQGALEKIKGQMTIIVIAHRLSTIKHADQVIVLDHGKVIQQGGFFQLADDKKGAFSSLLERQNAI